MSQRTWIKREEIAEIYDELGRKSVRKAANGPFHDPRKIESALDEYEDLQVRASALRGTDDLQSSALRRRPL